MVANNQLKIENTKLKNIEFYKKNRKLYESWGHEIEGIFDHDKPQDANLDSKILDKIDTSIYISIKEKLNGN